MLDRRVARWSRQAGDAEPVAALRQAVRRVVAKLAASGVVSDQQFAEARARRLLRAGKSGRATQAHLMARGVGAALAAERTRLTPDQEVAAAAIHLRRRRLGPFAAARSPEQDRKALGMLARAGFAQRVALVALRLTPREAEARIKSLREDA